MGLSIQTWDFVQRSLGKIGRGLSGINMCELGNQHIRANVGVGFRTAKEYFVSIGMNHVSIDLNGLDNSLQCDLSKPIDDPSILNRFDVVTNLGTTEHVGNQYHCFRNIHNLCKAGGMFIHAVPLIGHWMDAYHAGAHHYSLEFFEHLSHQYGYEILLGEIVPRKFHNSGKPYQKPKNDDSVCVAMTKGPGGDFEGEEKFNQLLSFIQLGTFGLDDKYGKEWV